MRRRRVGFALGAVAVLTAAGLLGAQAPPAGRIQSGYGAPRSSAGCVHTSAASGAVGSGRGVAADAASVVPRRRRRGVAERHRHRSGAQLRDLARAGRLRRLRGRREAGRDLLQQGAAADRLVAAHRHEREHGGQAAAGAGGGGRLRAAVEARRHRADHRLRQPRLDPAAVHLRSAGPRDRDPPDRCRTARPRSTTRSTSR